MPAAVTDYFKKVGSPGNATSLASPGHTIGGTTFTVDSTSLWPTDTGVTFAVDVVTLVNGEEVRTTGTYTVWDGVVSSATTITGAVLRYGTDQNYSAGTLTRVYILPTSTRENKLVDGILVNHNQTGTHKTLTDDSGNEWIKQTSTASAVNEVTIANAATGNGPTISATGDNTNIDLNFTAKGTGQIKYAGRHDAWNTGVPVPDTVAANGNRSYTLTHNSTDLTDYLSPGMRLRTTRTVSAPTQCTSLNGTTQYYSKSSPAAMTFTDDFVVSAWVKLSSYPVTNPAGLVSRYNGTSGWVLRVDTSGQIMLIGTNAGSGNFSYVQSYQSIPLNKWVHVTAQLDMSTFTATTTTSYVMIDGVDVPASVSRSGTNPTALVQPTFDLQIGTANTGTGYGYFPGKIAQVAIYNAKVAQATILASMNQGLSGSETSLISAYSFNNAITDLSANANNLTANGAAVATNADSPFGLQASGLISATLDYGIIQSVTFSTNTTVVVQVPEGCTIPTSGGVSAVSYSTQKAPYGMPSDEIKWELTWRWYGTDLASGSMASVWATIPGTSVTYPAGSWKQRSKMPITALSTTPATLVFRSQWDSASPSDNLEGLHYSRASSSVSYHSETHRHIQSIKISSATVYQLYGIVTGGGGTQNAYFQTPYTSTLTIANAYL